MKFRRRSQPEADIEERIEPLNEAEQEWVASSVAAAKEMVASYGIGLEGELNADVLDDLWGILLNGEPYDPNPMINLVGLAFGQLLADRLKLSWVALTDAHGTEIAVRGHANFTVFPTAFVAKRYATRETSFIAPAFREMVRSAESGKR